MTRKALITKPQSGRIVSVQGSVVDVCFDEELPPLQTMLQTGVEEKVVLEVMSQLDAAHVRAVALTPTQGLGRGMVVTNTGHSIRAPVGPGILGRMATAKTGAKGEEIEQGRLRIAQDMPWRNRRRLSLLFRPLVQVGSHPKRWMTFATWFKTSMKHLAANIESGHYPDTHFQSAEMKTYLGEQANRKGHEFTKKVDEVFSQGMRTRIEVEMHSLGASKQAGLGDIDVLAWSTQKKIVYIVECKRLRMALNVREVIQRLEDFMGDIQKKDSLGKHRRRFAWLEKNPSAIANITGMAVGEFTMIPLLITSDIVPMQFFEKMNFPVDQVVPYGRLASILDA